MVWIHRGDDDFSSLFDGSLSGSDPGGFRMEGAELVEDVNAAAGFGDRVDDLAGEAEEPLAGDRVRFVLRHQLRGELPQQLGGNEAAHGRGGQGRSHKQDRRQVQTVLQQVGGGQAEEAPADEQAADECLRSSCERFWVAKPDYH